MNYKKILRKIAKKNGVSVRDVRRELNAALRTAGVNTSAKHFIEKTANEIKSRTIYSNIV